MAESSGKGDEELPALLWDKMPEDPSSHPDFMALHSLMYDESTPLEQMENFKDQGNQRLKVGVKSKNKIYFHEAIKFYSQGLNVQTENQSCLKSILYSNRAQAELYLSNWRKALNDSQAALQLDGSNVKACYRGAKAAIKLDEITVALSLCKTGLELDSNNKELKKLLEEAERRSKVVKSHQEREDKEKAGRQMEAQRLMKEFSKRKISFCQSNFKVGKLKPEVDEEGVLHWPVLFVYPETMQQDIIQDVQENHILSDHLDIMFSPEAEPLHWDTQKQYTRNNIEVYYLANGGTPFTQEEMMRVLEGRFQGDPETHEPKLYGDNAVYFARAKTNLSLGEILAEEDFIIPGIPTFFIVAKGTNYHQRFLESITGN